MRSHAIRQLLKIQYQIDVLDSLGINPDSYSNGVDMWRAAAEILRAGTPDWIHEYQEYHQPEAIDTGSYDQAVADYYNPTRES